MHPNITNLAPAARAAQRPSSLQMVMVRTHLLLQAHRIDQERGDDGCAFADACRAVAAWMEAVAR